MKTKKIVLGIIISSTIAFGQNGFNRYYDDYNEYSTKQTLSKHYIKVVKREPVYEYVIERTPFKECEIINYPIKNRIKTPHERIEDNIGTILGGVAGGILGHQIGGGRGKTVATIGGAIIGSAIGHDISHKRDNYNNKVQYERRRVCDTKYRRIEKRVLSGYNNIGYFNGEKVVKFSTKKLRKINITLSVD